MEKKASSSSLMVVVYMVIVSLVLGLLPSGLAAPEWAIKPVAAARGPVSGGADVYSEQKGLYECFFAYYAIAPSCLSEMVNTVSTGHLAMGPACCNMVEQVKDDCWKAFLPVSPDLPPLLEKQCDKYHST